MKNKINLLWFLLLGLSFACKAQQHSIQCDGKELSIGKFAVDTMFTYDNRYVKENAVKSIKSSEFPIEIRIYFYGYYSERIKLFTFQARGDSAYITNKIIEFRAGKLGIDNFEIVKRGDGYKGEGYTVNVATTNRKKETLSKYCDFLSQLISNHLFFIRGASNDEKFINDPTKGAFDSQTFYLIEIKVNDKFRNLEYFTDGNLIDPDSKRGHYMNELTKILYNTLNLRKNQ